MIEEPSSLADRVRKTLLFDWDPIGVSSLKGAENEYDGYAGYVTEMLELGASVEEVFLFLWETQTVRMGMTCYDQGRVREVAGRLHSLVNS